MPNAIYIIWNGHFIDIIAPFTNVETVVIS